MTFAQYLKESSYWFGFKSPRWLLFALPTMAFVRDGGGVADFIIGEIAITGLLYFFYKRPQKPRKPDSVTKDP